MNEPCAGVPDHLCPMVRGGHGEMWGETVDASDLQQTVWPRLAAVAERRPAHNNAASIASSPARSQLKLLYYKLFARLYALVGRRADVVMARTALDRQQAGLWAGL